jgi:hypothetical protein
MPLGGTGAATGRNSERSREVQLLEEADLWHDDTDVAPRVIGGAE